MRRLIPWQSLQTILVLGFIIFQTAPASYAGATASSEENRSLPEATDIEHVIMIVFENTDYKQAIAQPFFKRLATEGTNFKKTYAATHPSQPNYLAMIAGDTFGVKDDDNKNIDASHLGDLLEAEGKTWKAYAEDWPGNCFLGAKSGNYARKHLPFISFRNIQNSPSRCARIVKSEEFFTDVNQGTLPNFSFFVPNQESDGHDTGVKFADKWYSNTFGPLLKDPKFRDNTLLITTFDEGTSKGSNQIYLTFWGPSVKPNNKVKTKVGFYNLLSTIEEIFGLGNLGRKDTTSPALEGWRI